MSKNSELRQYPDALIFDLDGTLWNACSVTAAAWNQVLEEYNRARRLTTGEIEGVIGRPNDECIELLLPGLQSDFPSIGSRMEKQEELLLQKQGGQLYAGVAAGIPALAARLPLYLVSNCPGWYLEVFMHQSGLKNYFSGYDCHGLSGTSKAEMLITLKSARALKNPVYIGDTGGDMQAAGEAGIDFLHAGYGFGAVDASVITFESFTALLRFFGV